MDQNKNQNQNQGQQNQNQPSRDQNPNVNRDRDQAEGSRESVRGGTQGQQGAGISNRPAERENQEQKDLPNRGQNREENR
jgi:hypothetical protein